MKLIGTNQTDAYVEMTAKEYAQVRELLPTAPATVRVTVPHQAMPMISGGVLDTRPEADPPAQIPTTFAISDFLAEGGQ